MRQRCDTIGTPDEHTSTRQRSPLGYSMACSSDSERSPGKDALMTLLMMCRKCGSQYRIPKARAGTKVRCVRCGARLMGAPLGKAGLISRWGRGTQIAIWAGTAAGVLLLLIAATIFVLRTDEAAPSEDGPDSGQAPGQTAPPDVAHGGTVRDVRNTKPHAEQVSRRKQKVLPEPSTNDARGPGVVIKPLPDPMTAGPPAAPPTPGSK